MSSKKLYEVQINSLCPPQAFLLVEACDEREVVDLTRTFLNNGSSDDFEKAFRVLHMPFEDAAGCGQYEIGNVLPVENSSSRFPILKGEDIKALGKAIFGERARLSGGQAVPF